MITHRILINLARRITIKLKDLLSESVKRAKEDLLKRLENESRFENDDFILNTSKVIGIGAVKLLI